MSATTKRRRAAARWACAAAIALGAVLAGSATGQVLGPVGLAALGLDVVVLNGPADLSSRQALKRLRKADPEGRYEYNHLYAGAGSVAGTEGSGAAGAPTSGVRVGLIDSGVAETHPAFAAVS